MMRLDVVATRLGGYCWMAAVGADFGRQGCFDVNDCSEKKL